jgi:5'-nucleotidase
MSELAPLPPLILISNDDGVDAPGIHALAAAAAQLGEVWVVAPDREQSARSHAFTMHEPLRVLRRAPQVFGVSGTPADSVYLGLHHVVPRLPALMLSGINRGQNVGDDTWYSGTVAAARECAFVGVPAIAVSLEAKPGVDDGARHWAAAARLAAEVGRRVLAQGAPGKLLNLNVPDVAFDQLPPIVVAALGARHYSPLVAVHNDPRGRSYYWIGGSSSSFDDQPGSDGDWFHRGHPTLTALTIDMTDHAGTTALNGWLRGS